MLEETKKATASRPIAAFADSTSVGCARWQAIQEEHLLDTFRDAARRIPAYRKFLAQNGVSPDSIRSVNDLIRVPPVSKENYLRVHPWEELVAPEALATQPLVLAATSGSTGVPFYFPRTDAKTSSRPSTIVHFWREVASTPGSPRSSSLLSAWACGSAAS